MRGDFSRKVGEIVEQRLGEIILIFVLVICIWVALGVADVMSGGLTR